jgi:hypothetical protein
VPPCEGITTCRLGLEPLSSLSHECQTNLCQQDLPRSNWAASRLLWWQSLGIQGGEKVPDRLPIFLRSENC